MATPLTSSTGSPRSADLAASRRKQLEKDYGQLSVAFLCDTQNLFISNSMLLSRRVLERYRAEIRDLVSVYDCTQKRMVVLVNFFSTESMFRFFGTCEEDSRVRLLCMPLSEALCTYRRYFPKTFDLLQASASTFCICACVMLKPIDSSTLLSSSSSIDLQGVHGEVVRLSELSISPRAG